MHLGILNIPHQIVGQVAMGREINTFITGGKESNPSVENMSQSRWKGEFCEQNKLAANFGSKF